ncbi:MAG: hypothetical protein JWN25_3207 [Verrucomicrobiales bacterium]|nr:hypothetical protein [Verrucomicrobiales bacterium]
MCNPRKDTCSEMGKNFQNAALLKEKKELLKSTLDELRLSWSIIDRIPHPFCAYEKGHCVFEFGSGGRRVHTVKLACLPREVTELESFLLRLL